MPEPPCPIARRFIALARREASAPALLNAAGEMIATRAGLVATAGSLAEAWSGELSPGEVVVLSVPNSVEMVASFLALRMLEARIALVDATAPADELLRCADTVGAFRLVVGPQRFGREKIAWHDERVAVVRHTPAHAPGLPAATAVLKLTSGSTGAPRSIAVGVRQIAADSVQIMRTMGFGGDDVTLAAVPLSHSYGFASCLTPLLLSGTPLVLTGVQLPAALAGALAAARVTHFPAVPAMIRALNGLSSLPPLPGLRVCLSAGAPLSPDDAAAFHALTGRKVHVFYGSSECGGITYDRSADPRHAEGYVGRAMERVRVAVVDDEGREQAAGAPGRVVVYSRGVALGCVPAPADPNELGPRRFLTGDLGVLDGAGGLTLTGRVAETLNVAGKKVHPEEVRAVLESHPGVREAAVVGIADPHRGQLVAAAVVAVPGFTLDVPRLLAWCRARLAPHKVPRRLAVFEALPVTGRGKLDREALRRRFSESAAVRQVR